MKDIPSDLQPLPTQPWSERPDSLPLDMQECRTALWLCDGNVSDAAAKLKVSSIRLRNFINNSAALRSEQKEARERIADIAERNMKEALLDPVDPGRRDSMTRFVLNSQIGRARDWGTAGITPSLVVKNVGPMEISWMTRDDAPLKTIDEHGNAIDD